jgi:SAM-dependent methyltransferase
MVDQASTSRRLPICSRSVTRFPDLEILNPKRISEAQAGRASWYPYYAGFSEKFAERLIRSARLKTTAIVSDPWNGSGTTTAAAAGAGRDAFGFDLNPVMVLAARARMLSKREKHSLVPLAAEIAETSAANNLARDEPLITWFSPSAAVALRNVEKAIQKILISRDTLFRVLTADEIDRVSDLAAFFYVALFRTTRGLIRRFQASNPTWLKEPKSAQARLRSSPKDICAAFQKQVKTMTDAIPNDPLTKDSEVTITLNSSETIPLGDETVDLVLSSPPYCTRIDYAFATRVELAVLGYTATEFDDLRRKLTGGTTVPKEASVPSDDWGLTCTRFLERLQSHTSKASATYYFKNHVQYFKSIYESVREISRILKRKGTCVLVVGDSYYKDLHNDLPRIVKEMGHNHGLLLNRTRMFRHRQTMARVNPTVRRYRRHVDAAESVLCFSRN